MDNREIIINNIKLTFNTNLDDEVDFKDEKDFLFAEDNIAKCLQDYVSIFGSLPYINHNFFISYPKEEESYLSVDIKSYTTFNDTKNHLNIFIDVKDITNNLGEIY